MNRKPTYAIVPPSPRIREVQDEWGMFDPNQAGLQAAFRIVRAMNTPTVHDSAPHVSSAPAPDVDVYELTVPEPQPQLPKTTDRGAVYTLEFPTQCPQCCKQIRTLRVSRLLRTQVSFTSTLPRKGYIIVCPECDGMLSAELSGLI